MVARNVLWNKVCLSIRPAICEDVFLELVHFVSLNFGIVLETLIKLCMTASFLKKTFQKTFHLKH